MAVLWFEIGEDAQKRQRCHFATYLIIHKRPRNNNNNNNKKKKKKTLSLILFENDAEFDSNNPSVNNSTIGRTMAPLCRDYWIISNLYLSFFFYALGRSQCAVNLKCHKNGIAFKNWKKWILLERRVEFRRFGKEIVPQRSTDLQIR